MSIRTRFMLVTCVIMLATIGILSVGGYVLTSRFLLNEVDKNLDNRVTLISELLQSSRTPLHHGGMVRNPLTNALLPTRFDSVTQVIATNGDLVVGFGEVDLPITKNVLNIANDAQLGRDLVTVDIGGEKYRMLTVPIRMGGALQIAINIESIERAKSAILSGGLILALFGMISSAVFAWISARRITRPIQNLAHAVEKIAQTRDLNVAIDVGGDREIKQLTASFKAMTSALQLSRDQQTQFLQDASHELRTPLTSLRANSELLQHKDLQPLARDEVLRDMRIEIDELTSLTSELSALATDQKMLEASVSIHLSQIVEEIVARSRRRFSREITLDVHSSAMVSLRQGQFERAMLNLIDNANKFSPPDGSIEISLRDKRIEVADHGPGIYDADKPDVFNRFFRALTTRSLPGSGLGLAIVKQFAEDHGAKVGVVDTPGGGATIFIEFSA